MLLRTLKCQNCALRGGKGPVPAIQAMTSALGGLTITILAMVLQEMSAHFAYASVMMPSFSFIHAWIVSCSATVS